MVFYAIIMLYVWFCAVLCFSVDIHRYHCCTVLNYKIWISPLLMRDHLYCKSYSSTLNIVNCGMCLCVYVRACVRACILACLHAFVRACVPACMRVCVWFCLSWSMICTIFVWFIQLLYKAAIVITVTRYGLKIDVHYRN